MIELFTHKQVRCEHCEFEFSLTGFGSAAMFVCPACGEENVLASPPQEERTQTADGRRQDVSENTETQERDDESQERDDESQERESESQERSGVSLTIPLLCSVEHCPLLTGGETGIAVAEQLGVRFQKREKRRRTILAWTVTLQVCVLIGAALFIAKMRLLEEKPTAPSAASHTEMNTEGTFAEIFPPAVMTPVPEEGAGKTAWNHTPVQEPFEPDAEPGYAVSPHETTQEILLHHVTEPNTLTTTPEPLQSETLPLQPVVEPVTLEMADELLLSAQISLAIDPESSVEQAVQAAKIYEQLRQPYPDSLYWTLGNAFAALSWGEPLLESAPAVETMTLSPDSRYLLAQLKDKTVWLWDLRRPERERSGYLLDSGTEEYVKFVFEPKMRWIIGGQKNGTIRIWDMSLKNPSETVITFMEQIADLQDLQISPDGQWLAAFGGSPRGVSISSKLPVGQPIQQVNYQIERFNAPDSPPHPVLLWNLRQLEHPGIVPMAMLVPSTPHPVQVIRFSPNSDRLAIARKDTVVRVYDLTAQGVNEEPFVLQGHQLGITKMAFAPSGQWIATGSQDNTVRLWSLMSSKFAPESVTLYGHAGWISALSINRTGEYVFSGSYDRTIRIWHVKRDRISSALNEEPMALETRLGVPKSLLITQDNDKMVVLGNEGSLGIYHLPSLFENNPDYHRRAVTFRNSRLSISKCLLTQDDQLLIFSYEHLSNLSNSGIRLWSLEPQRLCGDAH